MDLVLIKRFEGKCKTCGCDHRIKAPHRQDGFCSDHCLSRYKEWHNTDSRKLQKKRDRIFQKRSKNEKKALRRARIKGLKKNRKKLVIPEHPFYGSKKWHELRYKVIKLYGRVCMACGSKEGHMHVDHIKPRSRYPELELELSNLQILCRPCNMGKGAWDETDWRHQSKDTVNS